MMSQKLNITVPSADCPTDPMKIAEWVRSEYAEDISDLAAACRHPDEDYPAAIEFVRRDDDTGQTQIQIVCVDPSHHLTAAERIEKATGIRVTETVAEKALDLHGRVHFHTAVKATVPATARQEYRQLHKTPSGWQCECPAAKHGRQCAHAVATTYAEAQARFEMT